MLPEPLPTAPCASCGTTVEPHAERIDFAWQRFHGGVLGSDAVAVVIDRATVCSPFCGAKLLKASA